ncbi:MAG TPA: hypothetical protein VEP89_05910 [Draconibacterium sp.]|nr:hypothetical protein [Draconibacterium sp.]
MQNTNNLKYTLLLLVFLGFACSEKKEINNKLSIDFEQTKEGKLSDKALKKIWPGASLICGKKDYIFYKTGITPQSKKIVAENENQFLQVLLPKDRFGPVTGTQWKIPLSPSDAYIFSYKIKFDEDFDFVKGGKLPGLAGGTANTGGKIPTGYDGWSARLMFWEDGQLSYYAYFPDQTMEYGERFYFMNEKGDTLQISKGNWHSVKQLVKLNTVNKKDGVLQAWFDGAEVFKSDTMVFRNTPDLKIDQVLFNVFMGGSDKSWAPKKNEFIAFDDLQVLSQKLR